MKCKYCKSSDTIKKGKRNGIQRYRCHSCKKYFQQGYKYSAYENSTNSMITNLLKEGCGIRSISRILKISKNTVLSRMLKISKQIKTPYFNKLRYTNR